VPSFTIEAADLWNEGPLVDVSLGPTGALRGALDEAGQAVPTPVAVQLLVDTGASHSCVAAGVLGPLGLHPVGAIAINTPSSHGVPCALYAVRLTLPYGGYLDMSVIEAPSDGMVGQTVKGLLGRDVLQHGLLIYLGQRGQFTLSF
jgi:hypothetical protein